MIVEMENGSENSKPTRPCRLRKTLSCIFPFAVGGSSRERNSERLLFPKEYRKPLNKESSTRADEDDDDDEHNNNNNNNTNEDIESNKHDDPRVSVRSFLSFGFKHSSSRTVRSSLTASSNSRSERNLLKKSTNLNNTTSTQEQEQKPSASNENKVSSNNKTTVSYQLEENNVRGFGFLKFHNDNNKTIVTSIQDAVTLAHEHRHNDNDLRPICYIHSNFVPDCDPQLGREVFNHPLITEALESLFILISINNPSNNSGDDDDDDDDYNNFASSRLGFINQNSGEDLVEPMKYYKLSKLSILEAMITALKVSNQDIPRYLSLLLEETRGHEAHGRVAFGFSSNDCYSTAEVEFVSLDGILATIPCTETILEVIFDSARLSYSSIIRFALSIFNTDDTLKIFCQSNEQRIAAQVEVANRKKKNLNSPQVTITTLDNAIKSSEVSEESITVHSKSNIRRTPMRFVPITDLQKARINRWIYQGRFDEASHLLSPRQGRILMDVMRLGSSVFYDVVDYSIQDGWISVSRHKHPCQIKSIVLQDSIDYEDSSSSDFAPELYNFLS